MSVKITIKADSKAASDINKYLVDKVAFQQAVKTGTVDASSLVEASRFVHMHKRPLV